MLRKKDDTRQLIYDLAVSTASADLSSHIIAVNPHNVTKAQVGLGNADNTSDAAKPISTAAQTALDGKAALVHTHPATGISDSTATGRAVLTAADAAAARTAIGAGTSSFDGVYSSLSGIPSTFAPSAHAVNHQNGGADEISVAGLSGLLADAQTPLAHGHIIANITPVTASVLIGRGSAGGNGDAQEIVLGTNLSMSGTTLNASGGGGGTYTAFTKDLGVSRRTGTFDITGLSGLTANKVVSIVQTAAPIASKGDARDEPEMDMITLTGYVLDATTIRAYWACAAGCSVAVGAYALAYQVSG